MDKLVLDLPTRRWVPQWLGIVTVFVILLPMLLMNGAYTGSTVEVSNTLGVLSEDMTMAYYATSAGLAMAYPIIRKIRDAATSKTVLLFNLVAQTLLSFVCGYAKNMDVIIMCSFFIGFLKAFVMYEVVVMIQPFFSRKKVRSEFYAYFYPLAFAGGQVSIAFGGSAGNDGASVFLYLVDYGVSWSIWHYFTSEYLPMQRMRLYICLRFSVDWG